MILKIIFVILKVFLIGWIYAKIAKIDKESYFSDNNNQLTPPKYVLITGIATVLLSGFCTIVTLFTPTTTNPTATWQVSLVFALFTLAGFATLWNYTFCRHRFDDEGIYYTTFFRKENFWRGKIFVRFRILLFGGVVFCIMIWAKNFIFQII